MLIHIGHDNWVSKSRVVAVLTQSSSAGKRLRDTAESQNKLLDATHGKKTRSMIITDSNHVILSLIQSDTIAERFNSNAD